MTNEELLQALLGSAERAPAVDPLAAPLCQLHEAGSTPVGEARTMDIGGGITFYFERKGADAFAFSLLTPQRQTCNYSAGSFDAMVSFYIASNATVATLLLLELIKHPDEQPKPQPDTGFSMQALLKVMDELEYELGEDEDETDSAAD